MSLFASLGSPPPGNVNVDPTQTSPAQPAPVRPRIGGIDVNGAWTGGAPTDENWDASVNTRPKSMYCYCGKIDIGNTLLALQAYPSSSRRVTSIVILYKPSHTT
jgi:hypothetical protein